MSDRRLRQVAIVLALIGLGVAGYLTYIHYEGIKPVCGLAATARRSRPRSGPTSRACRSRCSACSATRGSSSTLFIEREEALIAGALIALVGFGFSAYLTYRELFSIDAICPWCVSSAVIMTLLAIVITARLLRAPSDHGCDTLRRVKKTSIYLDPDLDDALARRAADEGLTKAEFIRRTLAGAVQKPRRAKPHVGVFRSTDGLSVRRDWDKMMEGFGED